MRKHVIADTHLDQPAKLYIARIARKNLWRVDSFYELDDLIQDGCWLWYQLLSRERYKLITNKPQIMALFKRAYSSWIIDLANKRRRNTDSFGVQCYDLDPEFLDNFLYEHESSTFHVMSAQAPEPIQKVLRLLSTEKGCAHLAKEYDLRKDGTRETTNERLRRLCGIKDDVDLVGMIKDYFSPDDSHSMLKHTVTG